MANIWEKAISILVGNLNSGPSYLITTVLADVFSYYELGSIKMRMPGYICRLPVLWSISLLSINPIAITRSVFKVGVTNA